METVYLLTGAAGNLGSSITKSLIGAGKRVRALVLERDPAAALLPAQAEVVRGDLLDMASLDRFFDAAEGTRLIVIHCASLVALRPEFNQKVYDVNVTGTRNIVAKCIERHAAKLVYISSTSVIPELPMGQTIREVTRFDPDLVRGYYAKTKAEATAYVFEQGRKSGLDVSVIFPSGILGPNDYSYGLFSRFAISYANGRLPAAVRGSFNAVDVRDLAESVIACAERGGNGEGYIVANRTVSFQELLSLFQEYCNGRRIRFFAPPWLARTGVFFVDVWGRLTGRPSSWLTAFTIYNLTRNNDYSCEKAKAELGVTLRPFEETIRDTVVWLRDAGKIAGAPEQARHSGAPCV